MAKKRKPERMDILPNMDHVPPPDPDNFWDLRLDESRVIMVDDQLKPMLTLTVRSIHGDSVALQITADPRMRTFYKQ